MSPQQWNPRRYAQNARFVADLGAPVLEWLAPAPGERILDLGCGDGALTQKLERAGCEVVGVDASPDMAAAARRRGLDARVIDGCALPFRAEFDGVLSNAALHWMEDPDAVIAGVKRALKPGGRFVAEMGGKGNVAEIVAALEQCLAARGIKAAPLNPWYFPGRDEYRARLEAGGFTVEDIRLIPRPTPLPGDVTGWLATFAKNFTGVLPEPERRPFIEEVRNRLTPVMRGADDRWTAGYVRLRFKALAAGGGLKSSSG